MTKSTSQLTAAETFNFLITNRIPRRWITLFMGWYSRIESPLLTKLSIAFWKLFVNDLKLEEAKDTNFISLRHCFTRQLKSGLRPIDNRDNIIISPCDAIIGAFGDINENMLIQAKGFPYSINDLLINSELAKKYQNGKFITLRLKSCMYHRFHAPIDCHFDQIRYISGDTWNVNPIALKCIENLFCKNERAIIELKDNDSNEQMLLVPIAAILVASMKFHCLDKALDLKYKGANNISCYANYSKGDEIGYFQHGSTIILISKSNTDFCDNIVEGTLIKMGQALFESTNNT